MDYKDLNFDRQKEIYDEEFIGYINGLNESIKEHYKVSKINIKQTNEFLNFFKQQWETMKNSLNEIILNKSFSNINQILQIMDNSQNIINELIKNSTSNDKNLNLFFEDAKTLFKKMKLKRNENLVRAQRSSSHKNSRFNQKLMPSEVIAFGRNFANILDGNINQNLVKKIIYYLKQLRNYNEIVGKYSANAKYNYINLQNMLFTLLNENQNKNINNLNYENSVKIGNIGKFNLNECDNEIKIFEIKQKYENEISQLNNKIKELEKNINENKYSNNNLLEGPKIEELKKKIQIELADNNNGNNAINYNINNGNKNDFENMILNIIDKNKNLNLEIKTIKEDILKKNEMVQNLNSNINKLKYDLLEKDNIIQKKDNEITTLSQENQMYKANQNPYGGTNFQKNESRLTFGSNSIDSILELRKEMKNLYKENNDLRNQLNDLKINIAMSPISNTEASNELFNNDKNNESDLIKKELDLQKKNIILNKKKYEKEIFLANKKNEDLSKKLTSKTDEIINLQRENIKFKSLLKDKKGNNNINANNNEFFKLKNENIKLKNLINNYEKDKINMRNSLIKLGQENKDLNRQLVLLERQFKTNDGNNNYKENIMSLQNELTQLRKITEDNNNKNTIYEQQIINLENLLNEKEELINNYEEKLRSSNSSSNLNNLTKMKEMNKKLKAIINNKTIEIQNLKNGISNDSYNSQKIVELNNIIQKYKNQISSLNKQIIELKKGNNDNNQNELINKYKNDINELNSAFLKANSIIEEKDLMIQKLKDNMNNDNNQNLLLKIKELENKINELKEENKNLTDDIMKNNASNSNNMNEENINKINILNLKITTLEEENEYYKNKAEELQEQIKNLQNNENSNKVEFRDSALEIIMNNKKGNDELDVVKKENMNLEINIEQLNKELVNLKKTNEKLLQDYNQEKNKNAELIKENLKTKQKYKELLEIKTSNNTNVNANIGNNNNDIDIESQLKKKDDELQAINSFVFKLQNELEKAKEEIESYKTKINSLQKENTSIKNQLERLSTTMPKELNALQTQLEEANKKNKIYSTSNSNVTDRNKKINKDKSKTYDNTGIQQEQYNNILSQLNNANKEIVELKTQNKELLFQLEDKQVKSAYSGYRTEDVNISNNEEEFDLRKMANGAKEKNRSEDINIDYPGIQGFKEKLNELEFKYNNLVEQVKILIGNITFNQKIKPQITQICQLLGYSPKTTARIFTSAKDKKKILGI